MFACKLLSAWVLPVPTQQGWMTMFSLRSNQEIEKNPGCMCGATAAAPLIYVSAWFLGHFKEDGVICISWCLQRLVGHWDRKSTCKVLQLQLKDCLRVTQIPSTHSSLSRYSQPSIILFRTWVWSLLFPLLCGSHGSISPLKGRFLKSTSLWNNIFSLFPPTIYFQYKTLHGGNYLLWAYNSYCAKIHVT